MTTPLMLSMLGKISADNELKYFFYSSQKISFGISYKLSSWETICMKCQSPFSGVKKKKKKNRKMSSICHLPNLSREVNQSGPVI